jgi:3',5'-cyclic-nucleotide phosphodiesterase
VIELSLYGCNGGIGGTGRQTTCYGIGERIVIDAGTGLGTLSLDQLACIDHVVLTHAHLDHVACLPLMLDSVADLRDTAVTVWASPAVISVLRDHLMNDHLWPDFTKIPSIENPFLRFVPITAEGVEIDGYKFMPLPAAHGIPACGYMVSRDNVFIAFSGDTSDCPAFWEQVSRENSLKAIVVECSYPALMVDMANLSRHMHTTALISRISALPTGVISVVVHRKPGYEQQIASELTAALDARDLRLPEPGQRYQFT